MARGSIESRLELLRKQLPRIVNDTRRQVARRLKTKAQDEASDLFASQQYINRSGERARLGPIKASYRKAKVRAGFDPRRGHRTGKLADAIDQMVKLSPDRFGIVLRLPTAARRTGAGDYLDFYEEQKAPGLGSRISKSLENWWVRELAKRIRQRTRAILGPTESARRITDRRISLLLSGRPIQLSQRG